MESCSLLILAGGDSTRMGAPKHSLPFFGGTVLDFILRRMDGLFDEILVAGRNLKDLPPGVVAVEDARPVRCPLVGILSGMEASRNGRIFVAACDMPFVEPALAEALCEWHDGRADVTVPVIGGYYEPLCAVYRRAVAPVIAGYLDRGNRKTTGFLDSVSVDRVSESFIRTVDPDLHSFVNLNTPCEYLRHFRAVPDNGI